MKSKVVTLLLIFASIMAFSQDDFKRKGIFPYSDLTIQDQADTNSYTNYHGPRLIDRGPLKDEMSMNPVNDLPKPNRMQYEFMQLEMGLFIHYGMNTYSGQGTGGSGRFSPEIFNPTELDCNNWMEVVKAMGAKYAVLTARHEEGFCLWPTNTTDYSIRNSPYKNGRGDIVREFVEACRRHVIKPCLYISPYMDAHHIFKPGDPISWHQEWFKTTRERLAEPGATERFTKMQVEQIRELLTNYGPITYLWMDHIGETQGILDPVAVDKFWVQIVDEARRLQPECLLMSIDIALTRDAQAEGGVHGGRAAYPLWYASNRLDSKVMQGWPEADVESGDQFIVWESNTIFSGGWFWNGPGVKSVEEMKEHYLYTIGRGSTFLPNFAPDKRGLMTRTVMERASAFGGFIRQFDKGIAETSGSGKVLELKLPKEVSVNHILIEEELREGQKVLAYNVEARQADGSWIVIAGGQSIGNKRIQSFESIKTEAVRFRVLDAAAKGIYISRFGVFNLKNN
jgi:alpha-L-fucosidase